MREVNLILLHQLLSPKGVIAQLFVCRVQASVNINLHALTLLFGASVCVCIYFLFYFFSLTHHYM